MRKLIPLLFLLTGFQVSASIITEGTIFDNGDGTNTVDYWSFSTAGGLISIDVASFEGDSYYNQGSSWVDLNGDGESNSADTSIQLFSSVSGSLTSIATQHDGPLGFDNSISGWDPYLGLNLTAGDYVLAISSHVLDVNEALAGVNVHNSISWLFQYDENDIDPNRDFIAADYGDYTITWSDNVTISSVPEPSSLALMSFGIFGLGIACRRRKA